jgi:hypothetical protein
MNKQNPYFPKHADPIYKYFMDIHPVPGDIVYIQDMAFESCGVRWIEKY